MKLRLIIQPYVLFIFPCLHLGQSNEDLAKLATHNPYKNLFYSKMNSNHHSHCSHLWNTWCLPLSVGNMGWVETAVIL